MYSNQYLKFSLVLVYHRKLGKSRPQINNYDLTNSRLPIRGDNLLFGCLSLVSHIDDVFHSNYIYTKIQNISSS